MSTELLFENFDLTLKAPDSVPKLRELILQLAVKGKLVEQDPSDEPASVLLEKIKAEKEQLIKEGKIKKSKSLPPIEPDEVPYGLPDGWGWIRLNDIVSYIQRGKGPKYVESSDIPVISQKCIQWDGFKIERARFIDPTSLDKYAEERFLRSGDLLWNSTGTGTIGRVNVYLHEGNEFERVVVDSHVTVVRPLIVNSHYIYYVIASPMIQDDIEDRASGSTNQVELNTTMVKSQLIPLPPLNEQKRIIAKVDKLMALCDTLEEQQQKAYDARLKLNKASLYELLNAKDSTEFEQQWQLICENFNLLYDNTENLNELRQVILQLAVQGKLVPRDQKDEPASVLLEKIKAEKERLIKEKKIKKSKALPPIEEDEIPYGLADGWGWTRLGNVILYDIGGGTPSKNKEEYWDGDINWASVKDLNEDPFLTTTQDRITEEGLKNSSSNLIPKNNIIICTRMGLGKILINSIDVAINQDLRAIFLPDEINKFYFYYFYKTLKFQYSGTTVSGIRREKLLNFPIPLPPSNEQKRIVAKIDRLMALCDGLEEKIKQSDELSQKLLESVVDSVIVVS